MLARLRGDFGDLTGLSYTMIVISFVVLVALAVVIGFWCMAIFRGKGRSPGAGFALGCITTLFSPLLIPIVGLASMPLMRMWDAGLPVWGVLGLLLLFWLFGPAVAVGISYGLSARDPRPEASIPGASTAPADPMGGGTELRPVLVATFGPTTAWVDKAVTYDWRGFIIEGLGAVTAQQVLAYDDQGHLTWSSDEMRAWVVSVAALGAAPSV